MANPVWSYRAIEAPRHTSAFQDGPRTPLCALPDGTTERQLADERAAFDAWNTVARHAGFTIAQSLNHRRRLTIRARLAEHGMAGWHEALNAMQESDFWMRGGHIRSQIPNIDMIASESVFVKLIEGAYTDRPAVPRVAARKPGKLDWLYEMRRADGELPREPVDDAAPYIDGRIAL